MINSTPALTDHLTLFGYNKVEDVDALTALTIMENVEMGIADTYEVEFKTTYLTLHKLRPQLSMKNFQQTSLYKDASKNMAMVA